MSSVYIFNLNGDKIAKIQNPERESLNFGTFVSAGDGRIAISDITDVKSDVFIYTSSGGYVSKLTYIDDSNPYFGISSTIGGGNIYVGAPMATIPKVFKYSLNGDLISMLTSTESENNQFGGTVVYDNDLLAITETTDNTLASSVGKVFLYDKGTTLLESVSHIDNGVTERFGESIIITPSKLMLLGIHVGDGVSTDNNGCELYIYDNGIRLNTEVPVSPVEPEELVLGVVIVSGGSPTYRM